MMHVKGQIHCLVAEALYYLCVWNTLIQLLSSV